MPEHEEFTQPTPETARSHPVEGNTVQKDRAPAEVSERHESNDKGTPPTDHDSANGSTAADTSTVGQSDDLPGENRSDVNVSADDADLSDKGNGDEDTETEPKQPS